MRSVGAAALIFFASFSGASAADPQAPPIDGKALLRQMSQAARQTNYAGTFIYRHGNRMETSRIHHLVDASGEYEKLEALDGPRREVVRTNEEVTCFYPDRKVARIEQRSARRFPALVPDSLNTITENYAIRVGGVDRVAGHDCRVTVLEPRDALRYGYAICADVATGLPLRATTFTEANETVELFAFTEVSIGAPLSRDLVKARYDVREPGWRLDRSTVSAPLNDSTGWEIEKAPAGFQKVFEVTRQMQGKTTTHLVYSDGLAAVSVFVEPVGPGSPAASESSRHDAINVFSRLHGDHVVTVLGEVPAATVQQIGNALVYRGKSR